MDDELSRRIFGSDDDDDDDYLPGQAANGEEALDEDELRAQQIIASKQAKQPKQPTKRKRLQKGARAKPSRPRAEAKEGVEVVDAYEDADKDSIDGSEAMEDNTQNETEGDGGMFSKKKRRGARQIPRPQMNEEIRALQDRMETARQQDDEALDNAKPAVAKVAMMAEVAAMMRKRQYHEAMIDCGMLTSLAQWLKPMPDGSLVNLEVRRGVLSSLTLLPVDETMLGSLRSSNIGKYVKLLTMHCKERPDNKKMALSLVEKWTRPIFGSSTVTQASELPTAPAPEILPSHRAQSLESDVTSAQSAARTTRVPRALGMDFSLLPASTVAPLPSNKHAKESVKGRLSDRISSSKRKVQAQASALSIEGRGIDKL